MPPRPANTFVLTSGDGTELFAYRWLPPLPCKAIVQVAHGLAEHAARYARLAEALNAPGLGVYASDHRGHGQTCRDPDQLGFFGRQNGWQLCLADLWQVHRHIINEHPGLPIVLLGHSMGAALAQQFISDHGDSLAGAVLSGPSGNPTALTRIARLILELERLRLGPTGHSSLAGKMSFGAFNKAFSPARTPFDWLSRDPAEVDKYLSDPLCGFPATIQLWLDLLNGSIEASTPKQRSRIPKALPILVIAGSRDPVGGATRQIQAMLGDYRAAGLQKVEYKFYPEARHELLNEINRDEVTHDLIGWLNHVVGAV